MVAIQKKEKKEERSPSVFDGINGMPYSLHACG